jgi:hypothetical protein
MSFKPLRPGRDAARYVRRYLQQEGLSPKQVRKTLEHLAGRKKSDQFTDASPSTEGIFDHGEGGAYRGRFELSNAKPPVGELIGDNHPTNAGATPEFAAKRQPVVYGLVDPTHTGKGEITWDIYRGAHTHVGVARKNGLSLKQQESVATAFGQAIFDELKRYAQTGKRPPPYLERGELAGKASRALLSKAQGARPDAKVAKFVDPHDARSLKAKYRIGGKALRADAQAAFESQYVAKLPGGLRSQVKFLDLGWGRNLGGSNSELEHYYVLADFAGERRIVELKQVVPNPVDHTNGTPDLADARKLVRIAHRLQPSPDALMLPMAFNGKKYVAAPYDSRQQELNLPKLDSAKKLVALASNDGRLTARILAQSVSPKSIATWLRGVDVQHAIGVLRDYAMTYDAQAVSDAHAVDVMLDHS